MSLRGWFADASLELLGRAASHHRKRTRTRPDEHMASVGLT
jgi:hypothetical protein